MIGYFFKQYFISTTVRIFNQIASSDDIRCSYAYVCTCQEICNPSLSLERSKIDEHPWIVPYYTFCIVTLSHTTGPPSPCKMYMIFLTNSLTVSQIRKKCG